MGRNIKKVVGCGKNVTLNGYGSYEVLTLTGNEIKIKDNKTTQEITIQLATNNLEVI